MVASELRRAGLGVVQSGRPLPGGFGAVCSKPGWEHQGDQKLICSVVQSLTPEHERSN